MHFHVFWVISNQNGRTIIQDNDRLSSQGCLGRSKEADP